ncbi:major capsid protein [Vibrio phage vB_VhaP_PG11]|nr:major capsid protein [Vibrio phage vB_VhaP_PG11]
MPLNDTNQIKWGDGTNSSVGEQIRTDYYKKAALIEAVKEQYFQPLASVTAMPKHYGKTIKQYHMMPLLDDRNVNDQGIDAAGNVIADGNLYGSSKDIGTINSKLPQLSETGGRVNRVGYHRLVLEAQLENLGLFHEFTDEALNFDTMDDLYGHLSRELVRGASEITEDVLQIDLLNGAGVVYFGGDATQDSEMTGENGATASTISYEDLQRMSIQLDDNRTPKSTKILVGSRMIDTATIGSGRLLYIGSELQMQLEKLQDSFGNKVFVPVEQYAYAGDYKKGVNMIHGEIGKIGQFRIIVVPEMAHWAGVGAAEVTNDGYRATGGNYDVFPMLCIGSESFTTVGFQTSGKSFKFKIITKMPGEGVAQHNDPYGRTGFSSIQWYYGTMILRPERIALAKTVAEL